MPPRYRSVWYVALAVCCAQTLYAAVFIYRSSFIVEGQRYFCLFDDAMISMRYADNWARGHGLVWNPGERVEGYTHFAWTMVMGLVHLLPLSPSHACLAVQILGLVTLWTCVLATVWLGEVCRIVPGAIALSLPLVGFCYFLTFFSLMGMETGLLVTLVTLGLAGAAKSLRRREGRAAPMLWLGLALLVRMDAAIYLALVFAALIGFVRAGRARLLVGLMLAVGIEAAHVLWRHHFYGDWLPNTYYLKATGWDLADRIGPGIAHTVRTGFTLALCFVFAGISLMARHRADRLLLAAASTAAMAYQTYVGGDAWMMDRFSLPGLPGVALLAADGIVHMAVAIKGFWGRRALAVVLAGLALVNLNVRALSEWLFLAPEYSVTANRSNVQLAIALQRVSDPDARVAVGAAGVVPYFSNRISIDFLGKCDRHIARLPAHPEVTRAGHNKFDYAWSIRTYQPEVVLHALLFPLPSFRRDYAALAATIDGQDVFMCVRRSRARGGRVIPEQEAEQILKRMFPGNFR